MPWDIKPNTKYTITFYTSSEEYKYFIKTGSFEKPSIEILKQKDPAGILLNKLTFSNVEWEIENWHLNIYPNHIIIRSWTKIREETK